MCESVVMKVFALGWVLQLEKREVHSILHTAPQKSYIDIAE